MEHIDCNSIAAFDTLYTTNHIQMLKILSSYFAPKQRQQLAVWIKYMELQYTLSCSNPPHTRSICSNHEDALPHAIQPEQICEQLRPFCTEQEQQQLLRFLQLLQTLQMYQEISSMMELSHQISGEEDPNSFAGLFQNMASSPEHGDPPFMETLMNLLSPEQRMIFEMFGGQNDNKTE